MLGSQEDVINLVAFQNTLRQTALKDNVEMLVEVVGFVLGSLNLVRSTGLPRLPLLRRRP
jgi:hypothetical protein